MKDLQEKHNGVVKTVKNMVTNLTNKGWTKGAIEELKQDPDKLKSKANSTVKTTSKKSDITM